MGKQNTKSPATSGNDEYQTFAEQFVDRIFDPRQPWIIQYFLAGGFDQVPSEEDLASGGLALGILNCMERDWLAPSWLIEALYSGDRAKLVPHIKKLVAKANLTHEDLARLLKMADPFYFRQSLKELAAPFKFHRGPKPKIPVSAGEASITSAAPQRQ